MSLDHIVSLLLFGGQLYKIPEVVLTIVPPKKCHKVISHTTKFSLFTAVVAQDLYVQQKQIDKIVEEYQYVLASPMGVPPHYPIKQGYNRTLHTLHYASSLTKYSHN
jgi:hypothetical protein